MQLRGQTMSNGGNCSVINVATVIAVVVTYNPRLNELANLMTSLTPQVGGVVIVDNGSCDAEKISGAWGSVNIKIIRLNENLGIAAAQNIGIRWALQQNASFVLLSDQDSVPADDMVFQLVSGAQLALAAGVKLAAIGPCFIDDRQCNPPPFIRIERFRISRQIDDGSGEPVLVDYLIASGCLIPVSALEHVGPMKEELFIDYVDIEWGLRAKKLGFKSIGTFSARMRHSLGDEPIRFMGRSYPSRSPVRHYYMVRNAIWMCRQPHIPLHWKLVDAYKLILRAGFYALFAQPRLKHIGMMCRGLVHGLRKRMGPL